MMQIIRDMDLCGKCVFYDKSTMICEQKNKYASGEICKWYKRADGKNPRRRILAGSREYKWED